MNCVSHASAAQDYLDILTDHGLNQWVIPVIRYGSSGGTVIDHIMTNIHSPNSACGAISRGITDHESKYSFCNIAVNNLNIRTEYLNYTGVKHTLKNYIWKKWHINMDINKTENLHRNNLTWKKKDTTTRLTSHSHKISPWITKNILTSIDKKQSL